MRRSASSAAATAASRRSHSAASSVARASARRSTRSSSSSSAASTITTGTASTIAGGSASTVAAAPQQLSAANRAVAAAAVAATSADRNAAAASGRRGAASSASALAVDMPAMFCNQCEQTQSGTGCTTIGVCGKTPETSALQDLLIRQIQGLARVESKARQMLGDALPRDAGRDAFVLKGLFSTLTNVNFDSARFVEMNKEADALLAKLRGQVADAGAAEAAAAGADYALPAEGAGSWDAETLEAHARDVASLYVRHATEDANVVAVSELIVNGVKGAAAYAEHGLELNGDVPPEVSAGLADALAVVADVAQGEGEYAGDAGKLAGVALKVGELNLKVMEVLDAAHNRRFGSPSPSAVNTKPVAGPAICVSGHDLADLEAILQQTAGKGVNVFTHGEMLPAHGYPELRKHEHLVGHWGGAWQMQRMEMASFPGPIVFTSNCLTEHAPRTRDRIWTRGAVGWPGIRHVGDDRDYSAVVAQAQELGGFTEQAVERAGSSASITTGAGREFLAGALPAVVDAIKGGQLSNIFVVGGCDGAELSRTYFRDIATSLPNDALVLTAGCGKFRFNRDPNFGTLGNTGIPRLLDAGQCNDAYGLIRTAAALAEALDIKDLNDLPLHFAISWFEQKATAVLLSLLHLGIKNIYLGPAPPAQVVDSPALASILTETFNLKITGDPLQDRDAMLARTKA